MSITAGMVKELREKTGAGMMDCKKALEETSGDVNAAVDWLREKGIAKAAKKSGRVAAEGLCEIKVDGNYAIMFELNCETDFVSKNDNFKKYIDLIGNALIEQKPENYDCVKNVMIDGKTIDEVIVEATSTIGEKIALRRYVLVQKGDSHSFGTYLHAGGRIGAITIANTNKEEAAYNVAMQVAAYNPRFLNTDEISEEEYNKERNILREEALNEGKPENIVDKMVEGRLRKHFKELCLIDQDYIKDGDLTVSKYLKQQNAKIYTYMRYEVGEGIQKEEVNFADEVKSQMQ